MAIPEFTLTAGPEGFSRVMGGETMTAESLAGLKGELTPNIMGGQFLQVDSGLRHIDSVPFTLDEDGKLNGDTGIKLLANDPSLDLEKPIQWTISFDKDFRVDGFRKQFSKWSFIAPDDGDTKGLHELSHVTGQSATNVTRGVRGYSFAGFDAELSEDGLAQAMVQSDSGPVPAGDPVPLPSAAVDSLLGATELGKDVVKAADDAEARTVLGATSIGDGVFTAADEAAARGVINAHPLLPKGFFSAAGKSNGSLSSMDSGQSWSSFGNTPGAIESGTVQHHPVGSSATAAYYQVSAGGPVTRIMCKGYWPAGSTAALTFVLPVAAWGPVGGYPPTSAAQEVAGIHSSFYGNGLHYHSRWNVGTQTYYASTDNSYGSQARLPRYSDVRGSGSVWIEMWIDYTTGTLTFFPPDGGAPVSVQSDVIKTDCGPWVVWEQYEFNGAGDGDPFVIEEMHFDTYNRRRNSPVATKLDLAEAFTALSSAAYSFETVSTDGTTKTMTASSATLQYFTGSANHTLTLPTTGVPQGYPVIVQNSSTGVITINASGGGLVTALSTGQTAQFISVTASPTAAGNWISLPFVTLAGTQTLVSKRVDPRVTVAASASALTPTFSSADEYVYTALAANLTINAPTSTVNGSRLRFRIKDNGTSRTLTWNAIYRAVGATLPTATVPNKMLYVTTEYNAADIKWDIVDVRAEA